MPAPYRVLLVDDELSIIKTVGKRLELEGYEVLTAMDGEEALAKARAEPVDLIILDLMLPKLSGEEVLRALKRDPQRKQIPILILTAKMHEDDERRAMGDGADGYMRKPFRAHEMLWRMRQLLTPP
jgi:DNA-binding response OmpR family regulator